MSELRSKCCGAEVYQHQKYSWGYTWNIKRYTCLKCGESCEVEEKKEE